MFSSRSRLLALVLSACLPMMACSAPAVPDLDSPSTSTGKKAKKAPPKNDAGTSTEGETPDAPSTSTPEAPTLTSVTPDAVTVGSSPTGVELTLTGSRFVAGCKVDLGGTSLDATLASPTELKVQVPATQLASARALVVSVVSPTKGKSNALSFTVANPSSVTISSLAPQNALVGAPAVALTVSGSGFIATSTVRFNGAALPTTFRSATELGATIPESALLDAGRFSVTVTSGADVVSLPSPFEVRSPSPQPTTLSPSTVAAGSGATVVTLDGNGFTRLSEVLAGQTPLATTFVSAQRIRATLPATLLASAGTLSLTVQTSAPGGGSSSALTFTVTGAQQAACTYTCAEYGYAAGECFEGWACNGATGCLQQQACGGGGAASCLYRCADYGYAPGQCVNGWLCLESGEYAGCLGQTSCP